ncbi:hypothetical protein DER46DRAFT_514220 [Fusarium sp. MPI-SDFR-AT-0072]|nr:hypothetical protein DER46DRAFT_514220 [Fusarium sp. MPI-SDFR-AT-0072]
MSSIDHRLDKGKHSKEGRRRHHNHDIIDDPHRHCHHHHHHHHHVHRRPIDDNAMRLCEGPEWWSHLIDPSVLETLITKAIEARGHREKRGSEIRNERHHALCMGVRTGAEVASRIKNDRGPWAGEKSIKVVSAAITSATIDLLLSTDSKSHPLRYAVASMVESFIIDRIINGKLKL